VLTFDYLLLLQATSSFDEMGSRWKVADVSDAFGAANTMSVGRVFGKKHKKRSRKSADLPVDAGLKRPRPSSMEVATPTLPIFALATSTDISSSQHQGMS